MKKLAQQRLMTVVKLLREAQRSSKRRSAFDMGAWANHCGTPACALGSYAAREDLQRTFRFVRDSDGFFGVTAKGLRDGSISFPLSAREAEVFKRHFDLTPEQADELFGAEGCGKAKTPKHAADYIEKFIQLNSEREVRR